MMRSVRKFLFILVFALVFAACGGSDDQDTSGAAEVSRDSSEGSDTNGSTDGGGFEEEGAVGDDGAMEESADFEQAAQPLGGEGVGGDGSFGDDGVDGTTPISAALTPADIGRDVIYVATMDVTVADVAEATRKAQTEMAGLGALLFGQSTTTDPVPRTTITFKVFPEDFQVALTRLEGLGQLQGQTVTADDVTERIVDLESQIITAGVSVDRLRGFLEAATNLNDVAELERELLDRETDLETLRGQLRTLQDAAALATIHLTLAEALPPAPDVPTVAAEMQTTAYVGHDDGASCAGRSRITIDEGDAVTLCVSFTNTGNTTLASIEFEDQAIDLDPADFVELEGSLTDLAPGETVVVFANAQQPTIASVSPPVSVVAVDAEGERVRLGLELDRDVLQVEVEADNSLPSFGDALKGSLDFLLLVLAVIIIVAGALLPFFWVPLLAWVALRWNSNRKHAARAGAPVAPQQAPAAAAEPNAGTEVTTGS